MLLLLPERAADVRTLESQDVNGESGACSFIYAELNLHFTSSQYFVRLLSLKCIYITESYFIMFVNLQGLVCCATDCRCLFYSSGNTATFTEDDEQCVRFYYFFPYINMQESTFILEDAQHHVSAKNQPRGLVFLTSYF